MRVSNKDINLGLFEEKVCGACLSEGFTRRFQKNGKSLNDTYDEPCFICSGTNSIKVPKFKKSTIEDLKNFQKMTDTYTLAKNLSVVGAAGIHGLEWSAYIDTPPYSTRSPQKKLALESEAYSAIYGVLEVFINRLIKESESDE